MELRGRSSFQSPSYLSLEMIRSVMGGELFQWPAGVYVSTKNFNHIMMAMETTLNQNGVTYKEVVGTPAEEADLARSYKHLCELRDELILLGTIPPISQSNTINPNLN